MFRTLVCYVRFPNDGNHLPDLFGCTGSGCRSNSGQRCRVFDGQLVDCAGRADYVLWTDVLPAGEQYDNDTIRPRARCEMFY